LPLPRWITFENGNFHWVFIWLTRHDLKTRRQLLANILSTKDPKLISSSNGCFYEPISHPKHPRKVNSKWGLCASCSCFAFDCATKTCICECNCCP
jgi:hypothetical protein